MGQRLGDLVTLRYRVLDWRADSATIAPDGAHLTVTAFGRQAVVVEDVDEGGNPVYRWQVGGERGSASREAPVLAGQMIVSHLYGLSNAWKATAG